MNHQQRTALLWDWDGTIADTVALIVAAHHEATELVLGRRLDESLIRARIGEPARRRIGALVDANYVRDVFIQYSQHMDASDGTGTHIFVGIEALIADAAASGFANVIVTSRPKTQVLPVLRRHGLERHFLGVVGFEDTTRHKPSPEPLHRGAELAGAMAGECVYIGDAVVDIQAAAAAAFASVAVTWGAGTIDDLTKVGPDHIATSVRDLRAVLQIDSPNEETESA